MIRLGLMILALIGITSTAIAQQPTTPFVPIMIDLATFQQLDRILGDTPSKYANPIINVLVQAEQRAQIQERERKAKEEQENKAKQEKQKQLPQTKEKP